MPSDIGGRRPLDRGDSIPKQKPLRLDQMSAAHEETQVREREMHEKEQFAKEYEKREEINELTYNVVQKATQEINELERLIGETRLQKQDITKMRAFQDKHGRILLGSIKHVTEAFKKDYSNINEADLENLKVEKKYNAHGIKRIDINDELLTILKERGFKADIAKRGTDGELKKVGTVQAKWNEKENKMDVTFEEYVKNQGSRGSDASSNSKKSPVELALSFENKGDLKRPSDDQQSPPADTDPAVVTTTPDNNGDQTPSLNNRDEILFPEIGQPINAKKNDPTDLISFEDSPNTHLDQEDSDKKKDTLLNTNPLEQNKGAFSHLMDA